MSAPDVEPGATRYVVRTASPLTVSPISQSARLPAKRLASYTPTVGDIVAVIPLETTQRLVLGLISS